MSTERKELEIAKAGIHIDILSANLEHTFRSLDANIGMAFDVLRVLLETMC